MEYVSPYSSAADTEDIFVVVYAEHYDHDTESTRRPVVYVQTWSTGQESSPEMLFHKKYVTREVKPLLHQISHMHNVNENRDKTEDKAEEKNNTNLADAITMSLDLPGIGHEDDVPLTISENTDISSDITEIAESMVPTSLKSSLKGSQRRVFTEGIKKSLEQELPDVANRLVSHMHQLIEDMASRRDNEWVYGGTGIVATADTYASRNIRVCRVTFVIGSSASDWISISSNPDAAVFSGDYLRNKSVVIQQIIQQNNDLVIHDSH